MHLHVYSSSVLHDLYWAYNVLVFYPIYGESRRLFHCEFMIIMTLHMHITCFCNNKSVTCTS